MRLGHYFCLIGVLFCRSVVCQDSADVFTNDKPQEDGSSDSQNPRKRPPALTTTTTTTTHSSVSSSRPLSVDSRFVVSSDEGMLPCQDKYGGDVGCDPVDVSTPSEEYSKTKTATFDPTVADDSSVAAESSANDAAMFGESSDNETLMAIYSVAWIPTAGGEECLNSNNMPTATTLFAACPVGMLLIHPRTTCSSMSSNTTVRCDGVGSSSTLTVGCYGPRRADLPLLARSIPRTSADCTGIIHWKVPIVGSVVSIVEAVVKAGSG